MCRRYCNLCSLRTPRAFNRPWFSWQAQTGPPILPFVQSLNAPGLYSTLVLLAGTNWAADLAVCAVSERPGPLLDPGSPGRHKLGRRYCSLCSLQTPPTVTRPGLSWQARAVPLMLQLVQSLTEQNAIFDASGIYSSSCATKQKSTRV